MKKSLSGFLAACALLTGSLQFTVPAYAAGDIRFTNSTSTNADYDGIAAAEYAIKWANSVNPEYANFGYDGGDCTNFVSQALHAGGMEELYKGGWTSYTSWFYNGPAPGDRSTSWVLAEDFRQHWGELNYNGKAVGNRRAYQMIVYTRDDAINHFYDIYKAVWEGDVIEYVGRPEGGGDLVTQHANIVVDWQAETGGTVTVAQHSDYLGPWGTKDLLQYIKTRPGLEYVVILKMKYRIA